MERVLLAKITNLPNINAILPIQPKNFKITHQHYNNPQTNNSL